MAHKTVARGCFLFFTFSVSSADSCSLESAAQQESPLFIFRGTQVQRSGTSLTLHSKALGLLQPSQLLAGLEHQTSGVWPAVGLCYVAFEPCKLGMTGPEWEGLFLGEWPPSVVSLGS